MKNNNQAIIKRITKRTLRSDKRRNIFITTAVVLTTFMISSVFSIGMSFMESMKEEQVRLMGTVAHAGVSRTSAYELKQLKTLDYVKEVGTGNHVANIKATPQMGDMVLSLFYYDKLQWEKMRIPAYTNIVGRYPQNENELMAPLWVLEKIGITPELGMEIPLSYTTEIDGVTENHDMIFILSGWFTSYMHIRSGNIDSLLVSEALSQKYGATVEAQGAAIVIFKDGNNVNDYCTRLEHDLNIIDTLRVRPVPMYDSSGADITSTFTALAMIVAFLVFTGYLLIYNVMYISVSKDVRFYGLLKTIGTTSRQIRRIVTGQVLRLCAFGIPVGAMCAALISLAVVPMLVSGMSSLKTGAVVSFSPIIYLGGAVFALLTAFLGAIKPAKTTASVSPVEAQKYTGMETSKSKTHFPIKGKPYKMALRNIFRDRKRTVVVLLSLFLGLTTFITITTLVTSMDTDNYVNSYVKNDFILKNNTIAIIGGENEPKQKFDDNFLTKIKSIPGYESLQFKTKDMFTLAYDKGFDTHLAQLSDSSLSLDDLEEIKNNFTCVAVGIDNMLFDEIDKNFDMNAFERGDFLLLAAKDPNDLSEIESVTIRSWPEGEIISTIPVGGFVSYFSYSNMHSAAPTLIMSNTLMEKLTGNAIRSEVFIEVAEGYEASFLDELKELTDGDYEISRMSKIEAREEMRDAKIMLYILGGGIAFILGLIGVMNFINVMAVGVIVRKQELATLESIGMTCRQTRAMLLCEGAGYAVITLVLVSSLGNAITYGIFNLFQQQATYAVFTYPFIPAIITALVILTVCIITPETVYRSVIKASVVERLREA